MNRKEQEFSDVKDKFGTAIKKTRNTPESIMNLNIPQSTDEKVLSSRKSKDSLELRPIPSSDTERCPNIQRNIKFDIFKDQSISSARKQESQGSDRDYTYFNLRKHLSSTSSKHSKSASELSNPKLDNKNYFNSDKYISPGNHSKIKEDNSRKLFDYESSQQTQSFNYSDRNCPATPNKRVGRSSKNNDLHSPVTRILGIDSASTKVKYISHNPIDHKEIGVFM